MFHTQNIMWHWQLLYHVAFSNVSCVHSFSQQLHGGFSTASRSTSNSNSWNAKLQWLSRRSWYFARCNEVVLSFFFVFQDRRWCVEERWTEVVFTKGMVRSKEMHLYYQYRMIHTMGDDWDDYALKHSKFPVVLVPESWCVYIYIYISYFRLGQPQGLRLVSQLPTSFWSNAEKTRPRPELWIPMVLNLGETGGSFRYLSGNLVVLGSCVCFTFRFSNKCLLRKLSDEKKVL